MLRRMQNRVREHPFITLLFFLLLIAFGVGWIGSSKCWRILNLQKDSFWYLIAAIVAVVAFLSDRWQNTVSRRTQIQLAFFDRWGELMKEIEQLKGKEYSLRAENLFRRYFELLHMEYLMRKHIDPTVWEFWRKYQESEFGDKTTYAGRTFSDWWELLKNGIQDIKFKDYIESFRNPTERT